MRWWTTFVVSPVFLLALGCQTVNLNEQGSNEDGGALPDGGTGVDTGTGNMPVGSDSASSPVATDSQVDGGTGGGTDTGTPAQPTDTGSSSPSTDTGGGSTAIGTDTGGATAGDTASATERDTATVTEAATATGLSTGSDTRVPTETVTEIETPTATATETATATATAIETDTGPDLRELLLHRWSFNNDLADSVGGSDAEILTPGDGSGGDATLGAARVTLAGGSGESSDYVSLGSGLLTGVGGAVTVELWATQITVQNWSRIFEFGADTDNYLNMCWTMGTDIHTDRVAWRGAAGVTQQSDTNQPYTEGDEFHIVMIVVPGADTDSLTRVTWYSAPSGDDDLGGAKSFFLSENTLAGLDDTDAWLGRTHWTANNVANASYNEVRIFEGALSDANLETLHDLGPDVLP